MADLASTYHDAGFSDDEIAAHLSEKRDYYRQAGFTDDEIDEHFGAPKDPKGIPPAFASRFDGVDRKDNSGPVYRLTPSTMGAVAARAIQDKGKTPDLLGELVKDMLQSLVTLPQRAFEEATEFARTGEYGGTGDMPTGLEAALLTMGAGTKFARMQRAPATGGVQEQVIGGLPNGQDISNAATNIGHGDPQPRVEQKLSDVYANQGVHPAEVANDAQTDPTIAQSVVSLDRQDVPYGGEPPKPPKPPEPPAGEPPEYSDAEQKILSKISIGEKAPERALTWNGTYTQFIDKLFPITKAVKEADLPDFKAEDNPAALARLLHGSVGKADHFLNKATFDFNTYENNGPALKEVLAPIKDDLNGFRAYAAAKRAVELFERPVEKISQRIESGFDIDAAQQVVKDGKGKYEQTFRATVDYQNRLTDYLRDSGVLSKEAHAAMQEANKQYVPYYRVMGIAEDAPHRGGTSLQATNPIKKIKGSTRDIVDPIESIIRNTYHLTEMAERNQVGIKLVDMLKATSDAIPEAKPAVVTRQPGSMGTSSVAKANQTFQRSMAMRDAFNEIGIKNSDELAESLAHMTTEPEGKGQIRILRDGKPEVHEVDPDLASAMKGLTADSTNWLTKILAAPASVLRAGAVMTPEFWTRHVLRDFLYATTTFKGGVFHPVDMAKGLTGLITKDEDFWNWQKGGGGNISVVGVDRNYMQDDLRRLTGQTGLAGRAWNVVTDPEASMWDKAGALGKLPFQAISKFVLDPLRVATQIAENASHLGAFKKALGTVDADSLRGQIIRSAWVSRETAVDAARRGAAMRSYNMITAFANIKLQDTDRVVRALKDDPVSTLTKIGAAITVPSVTLWMINHDDPDYQEIAQWQKDMFWIIPVGSAPPSPLHVQQAQERGEEPKSSAGFFMRIPKPWAMGMIFGTLPERLLDEFGGHKPNFSKDMWSFFKDTYAVSGPDFVPTAAAPIIDQFANRSTFTNRTLIPTEQEKYLPEYQYTPYTTELTKELGKIVGAFPGMDQLKLDNSGWGGTAKALTSPILMENYIRGWTGTLGNYALQAADAALRKTGAIPDPPKPASTLADIPFVRSFVIRYPTATTESVQGFYDSYESNKKYFDTFMAKAKEGDAAAMDHIVKMGGPMMFVQLDAIKSTLSEHSQLIRDIYKNDGIPSDEKRQLIDQLYFSEIQVAKYGNEAIRQMREDSAVKQFTGK